jgi:phosphoglycolate phosphatase
MSKRYPCLIFDWDGTLIDSADTIVYCLQAAAADLDMKVPTESDIKNVIGLELSLAIKTLYPMHTDKTVSDIRESYAQHFVRKNKEQPAILFEGVQEGIRTLHEAGFQLAIATGKSRKGLMRVLPESGIEQYFHASRCADETASKPSPTMLHELMIELKIKPHEAVMIGDTEFDMEMAQRAGIDRIAVSYGAHHVDRLLKYQPVLRADYFEQLSNWLKQQLT